MPVCRVLPLLKSSHLTPRCTAGGYAPHARNAAQLSIAATSRARSVGLRLLTLFPPLIRSRTHLARKALDSFRESHTCKCCSNPDLCLVGSELADIDVLCTPDDVRLANSAAAASKAHLRLPILWVRVSESCVCFRSRLRTPSMRIQGNQGSVQGSALRTKSRPGLQILCCSRPSPRPEGGAQ